MTLTDKYDVAILYVDADGWTALFFKWVYAYVGLYCPLCYALLVTARSLPKYAGDYEVSNNQVHVTNYAYTVGS